MGQSLPTALLFAQRRLFGDERNDLVCLDLRVIVEGNPLFVLIPGLDGTRMCRVFATFLLRVRNKVCNADIRVFVEVR